jgi:DNA topoisomerase-1
MVLKRGRFGEFMACSGYPECRNTKRILKSAEDVTVKHDIPLEEECPVCGKKLAIKHGRYGEYTACSEYPDCKYIKLKSTGVRCGREGCTGEIVERKSRRGKTFYGCSNYPDCEFVLWNKPLPDPCPMCQAPFTVLKVAKRSGAVRVCNNPDCKFQESVEIE